MSGARGRKNPQILGPEPDGFIQREKKALRAALLTARRSLPAAEKEEKDARILAHLAALAGPAPVFVYVGQGFEIATLPFIAARLREGLPVCVPRTLGQGRMEARLLPDLDALQPGRLGILEPDERCRELPCAALGLIVVPGLAFDRAGYRLGRGGGYYDRYLAACAADAVGLCYTDFLREALPREPHDRPVGRLITEEGVRPCS